MKKSTKFIIIIMLIFILVKIILNTRARITEKIDNRIIHKDNDETKIPKTIVQSLSSRYVTKSIKKASDSWKNKNPNYNYVFFSDDECADFLKNNYDKSIYETFSKIYYGAYKADFFRYCYLYMKGGIWTDITSVCVEPLDNILDNNPDVDCFLTRDIVSKKRKKCVHGIYNSFMISKPKNPILLNLINHIVKEVKKSDNKGLFNITGPSGFGMILNKMLGNEKCEKLEDIIYIGDMKIKFFDNYIPRWDITSYSFGKVVDKSTKPYTNIRYNKFALDTINQLSAVTGKKQY